MSSNVTGLSRKKAPRRKQRRQRVIIASLSAFCAVILAMIVMIDCTDNTTRSAEWYVADGEAEILAQPIPPMAQDNPSGMQVLPAIQHTAVPTAEPAAVPSDEPADEPLIEKFARQPASLTLTAVGDCTLGGNIPNNHYRHFDSYFTKYGADYFFSGVRELFESDDLTIVNLEGPLTTSNNMRENRAFNFRGKLEYVNILSGSGVELCNLANNHAFDFGSEGFAETQQVLANAGIAYSGFSEVSMMDINGIRVCSLGFTEWDYEQSQMVRSVQQARNSCDLLLVSIHWGRENTYDHEKYQTKLGRALIDAGADLIIGNHSHAYGGIDQYKGKYIIYSLGNFCFGGNTNPSDMSCAIFQQTFLMDENGSITDGGINLIPARVSSSDRTNDFRPYMLTGSAGLSVLKGIIRESDMNLADVLWHKDSYEMQNAPISLSN